MRLSLMTYLVRDYDEAIDWFVNALGWTLVENTTLSPEKRWVRVSPDSDCAGLLLAHAVTDAQQRAIGNQTGGRVAFFLESNDFDGDFARMTSAGVRFQESPRSEPYGRVAVFEDLYGNRWDLIQPATTGDA